jgi:hypothetical protein
MGVMTTMARSYKYFDSNEELRIVVASETNQAAELLLHHNSCEFITQACLATNVLKQVHLFQTEILALTHITEDEGS